MPLDGHTRRHRPLRRHLDDGGPPHTVLVAFDETGHRTPARDASPPLSALRLKTAGGPTAALALGATAQRPVRRHHPHRLVAHPHHGHR
ncbi:hypothetical protein ACFZBC_04165 [Streptomyces luteogriseus]|uniref:hypothetical protein n=1 Tax=Streptomyces luteogriseus TaxID=68233 RepID=UPI0036E58205